MSTSSSPQSALDWPVYWFAALERAVETGDWVSAAEAQRQLERLGVTVNYRMRAKQKPTTMRAAGDER